jgi:lipoate-protein ligase A
MPTASLILDPPLPAAWNMAVDEALLLTAAGEQRATLRFYQWARPTLSLGYFQPYAERKLHAASSEVDVVRRASGGGAILHHHELTYSFSAPVADRLAGDVGVLYDAFHQSLVEALAQFSVTARLATPGEAKPFLCFQRRSQGDVLCGDAKICGSAQRRHQGAVLQHGSILLERSRHAPELPGILELTGQRITADELAQAWMPLLGQRLKAEWERGELPPAHEKLARQIERDKFDSPAWTERR